MKIQTYDIKKDKKIQAGELVNKVFCKYVDPKKHFMRIFRGYGIQEEIISKLAESECEDVVIITPTKKLWTKFSDWKKSTLSRNLGHGFQRFLPFEDKEGELMPYVHSEDIE